MELHVALTGPDDLSGQVYRQVRAAILDGRLAPGDRLPPTRELALRLEVSRNTVSLAYEWLVSEGLIHGRVGAGSFVESTPVPRTPHRVSSTGAPIRKVPAWRAVRAPILKPAMRYDFGVGSPDARLFPFDVWRRLVAREIRATKLFSGYGDPAGHPRLRQAIARHIAVSRGVNAAGQDVIITSGAQQAFDLVARVLVTPGTRVAVEEPGYPPARLLFQSMGARVVGVPVDEEGMKVDALPADARLVYVTPSHQFPLGMPMSHPRRVALLAWARQRNAVIIEDDYDSEFRFGGRPLETLQAMDRDGRVIYVGSFSKVMLPSLRIGFLVAPLSLRRELQAASYVGGWHRSWPEQAALASMIEKGLLARHVRRMRREYSIRHQRILETLSTDFATWVEPIPSVTGMHLCAPFRRSSLRFEHRLGECAVVAGVGFDALSSYYTKRNVRTGLVLGYGAMATKDISEGLARLRKCFLQSSRPGES